MQQNKAVIYTVILGEYDDIRQPDFINPNYDYLCFTDRPTITAGTVWQPVIAESKFAKTTIQLSRIIKMLPHVYCPNYDISLYIDGRIKILKDPTPLIEQGLANSDIAFRKHPTRNCLFQEAKVCIAKKLDKQYKISSQARRYRTLKYPVDNGLATGGIIARRHNSAYVKDAMNEWWKEYIIGCVRDQLSLNYILWKKKVAFSYFDNKLFNETLIIGEHKNR